MVISVVKLHNYCINESEVSVPSWIAIDTANGECIGQVPTENHPQAGEQQLPCQLLDESHFNNVPWNICQQQMHQFMTDILPREHLRDFVPEQGLTQLLSTT